MPTGVQNCVRRLPDEGSLKLWWDCLARKRDAAKLLAVGELGFARCGSSCDRRAVLCFHTNENGNIRIILASYSDGKFGSHCTWGRNYSIHRNLQTVAFQDNLVCVNQLRYYDVLFRDLIAFKAQVLKVTQARIQINRVRVRNAGVSINCFRLLHMGRVLRNRAGYLERFLHDRMLVRVIAEAVVAVRQRDLDGYFLTFSGVRVLKFCRDGVIRTGRQAAASDAAGCNGCVCRTVVGARLNGGRKGRVGQINPLNGQPHGVRRKRIVISGYFATVRVVTYRFVSDQCIRCGVLNCNTVAIPLIGYAAAAIRLNCCREFYRRAVRNCRFSIGRNRHGAKRQDFYLLGRIRCKARRYNVALCLPARRSLKGITARKQPAVVFIGRACYVDGVVFAAVERELAVACDFQPAERAVTDRDRTAAEFERRRAGTSHLESSARNTEIAFFNFRISDYGYIF